MAKKRKIRRVPPARGARSRGVGRGTPAGKAIIVASVEEFDRYAAGDKPLVIDFWASWCGPCRVMAPIFEDVAAKFEGRVHFLKVDTERVPALAEAFSIRSIPTLVVLDAGEVIDSNIGVTAAERLEAMARRAIDRRTRVGWTTRLRRFFSRKDGGPDPSNAEPS